MTEYTAHVFQAPPEIDRVQRLALIVALVGLAAAVFGAIASPVSFYRAYLIAFIFVLAVPMGSLALLMIQHLSGGGWGVATRRTLEASARTLPLIALLFIPVAFGMHHLYEWTHLDVVAKDPILQWKAPYLNTPFFLVRAALYFVLWIALALLLTKWSKDQDARGGDDRRLRLLSGAGILLYGLSITFAAVDWVMSLDPHWYSTIFGMILMVSEGLSALAFTIVMSFYLSRRAPMQHVLTPQRFHDLGKLLLGFVMLYAYLAFSQFLIVWSANLPEEVPWYLARSRAGWTWLSAILALGHFVFPFGLLLLRDMKRNAGRLAGLAVFILGMRFVETLWLIAPQFQHDGLTSAWLAAAITLGLFGLWLVVFCWNLKGRALLPVGDPYLEEALADGHH
jgi:hypothetical protein